MKILFKSGDIERAIEDIASWVLEIDGKALVGIRTGGEFLARRVLKLMGRKEFPAGFIDITFWRDDLSRLGYNPEVKGTKLEFPLDGSIIVLIDDVIFTGRTVRAALSEIMEFGRPDMIKLAVLVDRGHREVPIQPDFVSFRVETKKDQIVEVLIKEKGYSEDTIVLLEKGERI